MSFPVFGIVPVAALVVAPVLGQIQADAGEVERGDGHRDCYTTGMNVNDMQQ